MKIISPTGSWTLRNDEAGHGFFGAPRGSRSHNGVDLLCVPGQVVSAPISGKIVREAFPYASDLKWSGCLIVAPGIELKMFYMRLYHHIRKQLKDGPVRCVEHLPIGVCQDITNKYPDQGMKPHLHLEAKIMQRVNPMDLV